MAMLNNQRVNAMLYHPLMGSNGYVHHPWWDLISFSTGFQLKTCSRPASSRSERFRNPRKKKTTPMIAWSVYSVGGFSSMLGRFKSHTKPPMNPEACLHTFWKTWWWKMHPFVDDWRWGFPLVRFPWFPEERSQRLVPQNGIKISNEMIKPGFNWVLGYLEIQ